MCDHLEAKLRLKQDEIDGLLLSEDETKTVLATTKGQAELKARSQLRSCGVIFLGMLINIG